VWTDEFGDEVVDPDHRSGRARENYTYEACPDEILGMGTEQFAEYVEHIADRRLGRLDSVLHKAGVRTSAC